MKGYVALGFLFSTFCIHVEEERREDMHYDRVARAIYAIDPIAQAKQASANIIDALGQQVANEQVILAEKIKRELSPEDAKRLAEVIPLMRDFLVAYIKDFHKQNSFITPVEYFSSPEFQEKCRAQVMLQERLRPYGQSLQKQKNSRGEGHEEDLNQYLNLLVDKCAGHIIESYKKVQELFERSEKIHDNNAEQKARQN